MNQAFISTPIRSLARSLREKWTGWSTLEPRAPASRRFQKSCFSICFLYLQETVGEMSHTLPRNVPQRSPRPRGCHMLRWRGEVASSFHPPGQHCSGDEQGSQPFPIDCSIPGLSPVTLSLPVRSLTFSLCCSHAYKSPVLGCDMHPQPQCLRPTEPSLLR